MSAPPVTGVHHVKIAVSELERSRAWYTSVLGLQVAKDFVDDDGVTRGLAGQLCDAEGRAVLSISLRQNLEVSAGTAGFDPLSLSIADPEVWAAHLAEHGLEARVFGHAPVLAVRDPDEHEIRLFGPNG